MIIKWKCVYLLSNSLNLFFKKCLEISVENLCVYCGLKPEQTRYLVLRRSMYSLRTADVFRSTGPVDPLQIVEFAANLEEATTGEEIFSFNLIKRT